jgi:predicted DNA-binding WGR domain protein
METEVITRHEFHEFPRTKGAEDMALRLEAKKRSKRQDERIGRGYTQINTD